MFLLAYIPPHYHDFYKQFQAPSSSESSSASDSETADESSSSDSDGEADSDSDSDIEDMDSDLVVLLKITFMQTCHSKLRSILMFEIKCF